MTTSRSVAASTRSESQEVFAWAESRGADRASKKWALKISVPLDARASMKPTNRARSAWWNCAGGKWAVRRGSRRLRASASARSFSVSQLIQVRSSSA
jgi:hypothetical protein